MGILKRTSAQFARAPLDADARAREREIDATTDADDADAAARDGAGVARASASEHGEVVVMEYAAFHARVDAVFDAVVLSTTTTTTTGGAGSDLKSRVSAAASTAWRPRSSAVVRRGAAAAEAEAEAEAEDDDDSEDECDAEPKTFSDDLDCLESDEDGDDDARRMARLRASVGRCRALNDEAEFDDIDAMACGADAADDVADARRRAIAAAQPPSRRVPDHIAHPERYTRYELEEPLVVGGGASTSRDRVPEPTPKTPDARREAAPVALEKPTFVQTKKRKAMDATTTTTTSRVKLASTQADEDVEAYSPPTSAARTRNLRKRA